MKASIRSAVLLVLVLALILTLLFSITTPLIYSLEKDTFPSRFHNNTEALKRQPLNSTEDILPLMQDLSDYSGPIILNVRLDNPEQARRDLELFAKKRVALSNLVIKLDMTESEMQEYSNNRALQNQLLSELVNSSVSLNELKKLEVQYRGADNPAMLMSVQLEGEALHKRMQELYNLYENKTTSTTATGKKLGLDTAQDEKSVSSFRQYLEETAPTERSPVTISPERMNLLTFLIIPEQVRYGDTIRCSGYLFSPLGLRYVGIPDKNVTVYIDNEPVSVSGTDSSGEYTVQLPIERQPAGMHTMHAETGTLISETQTLTVLWADSITTLSPPVIAKGEVTVSGSVRTSIPVRNASVEIIRDGAVARETVTDGQGQFREVMNLPPGKHTLVARFSGNGFPIHPSESMPRVIVLPADYSGIIPAGTVLLTLVLFSVGALYYLRRMRGVRTGSDHVSEIRDIPEKPVNRDEEVPGTQTRPEHPPDGNNGNTPMVIPDSLISRYTRILQQNGISEAAHEVYLEFSRRIAHDQQIKGYISMTPGELSRFCRKKPYCGAFSRFVSLYETVRYGGMRSGTIQAEFEVVFKDTDVQLGGEEHKD